MQNDYEILGVAPGADQKEIKRAYFKLVRQFSPEKEPERFQEIRAAYERVTQTESQDKETPVLELEMPKDPMASRILEHINLLFTRHEYENASAAAMRAIDIFGEYEAFLYKLAYSQRLDGHSGKALKNYEKLVEKYPEKAVYKKELAIAYYDRGYGRKALAAFETAYAAGVRDLSFLLDFSLCCRDRRNYSRGLAVLLEITESYDNTKKNRLSEYLEAYTGLFAIDHESGGLRYGEFLERYESFLTQAGRLLKEYDVTVLESVFFITNSMTRWADRPRLQKLLDELKRVLPERRYPEAWDNISASFLYVSLKNDERLGEEIRWCHEAYMLLEGIYGDSIARFMQLDCSLILLERLEKLKPQFAVVKEDYPQLYMAMKDFFDSLESEDLSYLKNKMIKTYDRQVKNFIGGRYYQLYPPSKPVEKIRWTSGESGAFIRSDKKTGRNDPCPCGSGKKYKKCCGRDVVF